MEMIEHQNELVSIIVPVYRCENYIEKCVQSIIDQSYKNIEIILVLDGELDRSGGICRRIASQDSRIRVIEKEHEGVSIARNEGLKVSIGDWVAFVDSDDWLEKNYIEIMLYEARKKNSDIIICSYYTEYKNQTVKDSFFTFVNHDFETHDMDLIIESCLISNSISKIGSATNVGVPWAKLYRADFVKNNGLLFVPGLKRMQDTVFNLYAFSKANKVTYRDIPLYHYTKNETAVTMRFSPDFHDIAANFIYESRIFMEMSQKNTLYIALKKKTIVLILEMINLEIIPQIPEIGWFKCREKLYKNIYREPFFSAIYDIGISEMRGKRKVLLILLKLRLLFPILYYAGNIEHKKKKLLIKNSSSHSS